MHTRDKQDVATIHVKLVLQHKTCIDYSDAMLNSDEHQCIPFASLTKQVLRSNDTVRLTAIIVGAEIQIITLLKQIRIWSYSHSIRPCVNRGVNRRPDTVTIQPYTDLF